MRTVRDVLQDDPGIEKVYFVCFGGSDLEVYLKGAQGILGD